MRTRNVVLVVIFVLMAVLAWRNWTVFSELRPLSLVFVQVQAPLGIVMLVIIAVLVVVYFLYTVGLETAALLEVKRYARELLQTRKLAEDAETSRFTDLKKWLEAELSSIKAVQPSGLETKLQEVLTRIGQTETELRDDIEKAGNTIAAYIGELEDQITGKDAHKPPLR
ncbi:MAG: DNA cytosine methyltransferase [Thermaceae bacterium]|nr:DNA cytosine methyltransferase [Thermaceae bacterium]